MVPNSTSGSWFPLSAQISRKKRPQLAGILGGMELGPRGVALGEGHRENLAIAGMFLSFAKSKCVDQPHGRDLSRTHEPLGHPERPVRCEGHRCKLIMMDRSRAES